MIKDIINSINTSLQACLGEDAIFYSLAQVVEIGTEKYPIVSIDGKSVRICPNDSVQYQIYHRINGSDFTIKDNEDYSFGRKRSKELEIRVKMVIIMRSNLTDEAYPFEPLHLAQLMPTKAFSDDYINISIEVNTVTNDSDLIVKREWKRIDYSKYKCKFHVFEVGYTIRAVACNLVCEPFLIESDG